MKARLVRLVEVLVLAFVERTGRVKKSPLYKHYVRVRAGRRAGETRRLNKELAKANAGASLQFPTIEADDTELCA